MQINSVAIIVLSRTTTRHWKASFDNYL